MLFREPRPTLDRWLLLMMIVGSWAAVLLFFSTALALASIVIFGAAVVYGMAVATSRVVTLEPQTRTVVIQWLPPLLTVRRKKFPLSQFGSVISYCALGSSMNWVCLLERNGNIGLVIANFDLKYQSRSFWDLRPKLVEADKARDLRDELVANLALTDGGFSAFRWSHPKPSKPAGDLT